MLYMAIKKIQDIHCSAHTTKSKALTNRYIEKKISRKLGKIYAFLDNLFVTTMSFFFAEITERQLVNENMSCSTTLAIGLSVSLLIIFIVCGLLLCR